MTKKNRLIKIISIACASSFFLSQNALALDSARNYEEDQISLWQLAQGRRFADPIFKALNPAFQARAEETVARQEEILKLQSEFVAPPNPTLPSSLYLPDQNLILEKPPVESLTGYTALDVDLLFVEQEEQPAMILPVYVQTDIHTRTRLLEDGTLLVYEDQLLKKVVTPEGLERFHTYLKDSGGGIIEIAVEDVTRLSVYGADGLLTNVLDKTRGITAAFSSGVLERVEAADGTVILYSTTQESGHAVASVQGYEGTREFTDASGNVFVYVDGGLSGVRTPDGELLEELVWGGDGFLEKAGKKTLTDGRVIRYELPESAANPAIQGFEVTAQDGTLLFRYKEDAGNGTKEVRQGNAIWSYDNGRVMRYEDPVSGVVSFVYSGQTLQAMKRQSGVFIYTYDADGKILSGRSPVVDIEFIAEGEYRGYKLKETSRLTGEEFLYEYQTLSDGTVIAEKRSFREIPVSSSSHGAYSLGFAQGADQPAIEVAFDLSESTGLYPGVNLSAYGYTPGERWVYLGVTAGNGALNINWNVYNYQTGESTHDSSAIPFHFDSTESHRLRMAWEAGEVRIYVMSEGSAPALVYSAQDANWDPRFSVNSTGTDFDITQSPQGILFSADHKLGVSDLDENSRAGAHFRLDPPSPKFKTAFSGEGYQVETVYDHAAKVVRAYLWRPDPATGRTLFTALDPAPLDLATGTDYWTEATFTGGVFKLYVWENGQAKPAVAVVTADGFAPASFGGEFAVSAGMIEADASSGSSQPVTPVKAQAPVDLMTYLPYNSETGDIRQLDQTVVLFNEYQPVRLVYAEDGEAEEISLVDGRKLFFEEGVFVRAEDSTGNEVPFQTAGTFIENFAPARVDAQADRIWYENPFLSVFEESAHAVTALPISHIGSNDAVLLTHLYDAALYIMADGKGSRVMLEHLMTDSPFVANTDYDPPGGLYSTLSQTGEWQVGFNTWNVHAGPNAWIGIAALYEHSKMPEQAVLDFAVSRANFLWGLWDEVGGGLTMGPAGQFGPFADIKSTENNMSALHLFELLHELTGETVYAERANEIWEYLKTMYDAASHTFLRGENRIAGTWTKDPVDEFATDTTAWMPVQRMFADAAFGATEAERLAELERMMTAAENLTGVRDEGGNLLGFAFSLESAAAEVISIEWSSQFACLYLKAAQMFEAAQDTAKRNLYTQKYEALLDSLGNFFNIDADGRVSAPYAVFSNGEGAYSVSTGHDFPTPGIDPDAEYVSSIASIYYLLARQKSDPFSLGLSGGGEKDRYVHPAWRSAATDSLYTLQAQFAEPAHPASGAINNVYGDPTWVVPRENAMAILGLLESAELLGPYADGRYGLRTQAQEAADYLVRIQDVTDGGWFDQYSYEQPSVASKSPTQTAEVLMAFHRLGFDGSRYAAMKMGAEFVMSLQDPANKGGSDDGLIGGGIDASGSYQGWRWASDNAYAYLALRAAADWARQASDTAFAAQAEASAAAILQGIDSFLYITDPGHPDFGVWHRAVDRAGNPVATDTHDWINYAPQMLDIPALGTGDSVVGDWIHRVLQKDDGAVVWNDGAENARKSPGFTFQAMLVWADLGQSEYYMNARGWVLQSGLWIETPDANGIAGGWVDWIENGSEAPFWQRFIDTNFYASAALSGGYDFSIN